MAFDESMITGESKPVTHDAGDRVVAIPLAAGALAWAGVLLPPAAGALAMSVSTNVVALNATLLRRLDLRPAHAATDASSTNVRG